MQNSLSKENYFIGFALSNSSNYDSSICVLDRFKQIVLLDKFYFINDIDYFFETSPYVKNSLVGINVAYDNSLLEGKWRIHSKNYKVLFDNFKINTSLPFDNNFNCIIYKKNYKKQKTKVASYCMLKNDLFFRVGFVVIRFYKNDKRKVYLFKRIK